MRADETSKLIERLDLAYDELRRKVHHATTRDDAAGQRRRMKRHLFTILSALSLLVLVANVVVWSPAQR